MKLVRFKFKGDNWNAYLVPGDEMGEFVDDKTDETAAEIHWYKNEIYFNADLVDLYFIKHELWHMASGYHHIQNCDLDLEQMEEFNCDLFAYEGEDILKLSKELHEKIEELKKSTDDNLELEIIDDRKE